MSSVEEDQSFQPSSQGDGGADVHNVDALKSVEDFAVRINGLVDESAGSASESGYGSVKPKENGLGDHTSRSLTSSHKHHSSSSKSGGSSKDKLHNSSSSKYKEGSSTGSAKHNSYSTSSKHKESSSSKHKEGHSSSSSSKHKEGSNSQHNSSSSLSKHKEGSSSSKLSSPKDKEKSSSSKPKDSSSSSPDKQSSSSGSSKHRESSKHNDNSSSSSSKTKEGSSSSKDKSSSSSSEKPKDTTKAKNSSSSSSDKYKDKSKESTHNKEKDKPMLSSPTKYRERDKHSISTTNGDKQTSSKGDGNSLETKASTPFSNNMQIKKEIDVKSNVIEAKTREHIDIRDCHVTIKRELISSSLKTDRHSVSPSKHPDRHSVSPSKHPDRLSVSPSKHPAIKPEIESEDDEKPLSVRRKEIKPVKRRKEESDWEDDDGEDSDVPLSARNKAKKLKSEKKSSKKMVTAFEPAIKFIPAPQLSPVPKKKAVKKKIEVNEDTEDEPAKKKKKGEDEQSVWKWWEEQREDNGVKWTFLEHKGPIFAPLYERLPKSVRFYYDGKPMELTQDTEEMATFYGRMLDHDYTTRDVFNTNFMKDWRKVMTLEEKAKITDLKKCNFHEILDYFKKKTEEKKAMSKEEKQKIKKENEELVKEYGYCTLDNHKEKIGNFKIEPPGLFRGRGNHPKQGMHKKRIVPEDVIINCSKNSKIPVPPAGHKWKEVRHDNAVTWLASWTENIQGATKYIMLNAASKLKGEKDWQKYETARKLHKCVDKIRAQYQEDWKSKEMRIRQRAVALYFIDKLALRAGNEKEEGETADTVGCCSLRVEHIKLHNEKDGKQHVVEFDFLGKDSIRYQNAIPVEKRVFKNLQLFMENKQPEDDLFDRLNTTILNKHLQDLMDGLTAKVFRTFNASKTLSEQLELLTNSDDSPAAKMLAYNRANRAVAILCNHQRAVPKTFEKSMENLMKKVDAKKAEIREVKKEIKAIKAEYKQKKSVKTKALYDKKKKTLSRLEDQLTKMEVQATDKDENKEIALGTSKLNYLDPRISVAWCKKFGVPLEKVYNKTQRDKFRWAIDMTNEHFKF